MSHNLVELVVNQDTRKQTVHAARSGQTLCGLDLTIGHGWIAPDPKRQQESDALPQVTCGTCRSVIERNRKVEATPG